MFEDQPLRVKTAQSRQQMIPTIDSKPADEFLDRGTFRSTRTIEQQERLVTWGQILEDDGMLIDFLNRWDLLRYEVDHDSLRFVCGHAVVQSNEFCHHPIH